MDLKWKVAFLMLAFVMPIGAFAQIRITTENGTSDYNPLEIDNLVFVANNKDIVRESAFEDTAVPDNHEGQYFLDIVGKTGEVTRLELFKDMILAVRVYDIVLEQSSEYGSMSLLMSDVDEIKVTKTGASEILVLPEQADTPTVRFDAYRVIINGLEPLSAIEVYNVGAERLFALDADSHGTAIIDFGRFAGQILIVKSERVSLRIKI